MTSTPKRASTVENNWTVAPKTLAAQTTWSPAFRTARHVAISAAMPDEVARQSSAPSSEASRRSNMVTVGLLKRE